MTRLQIAWAEQHDWFVRDNGDGSITVLERALMPGGGVVESQKVFSDIKLLRIWAGY